MEKIQMSEAKKMEREGFQIFHIGWFTVGSGYGIIHKDDLMKKNPDCSHALVSPNTRWLATGAVAALILKENPNGG